MRSMRVLVASVCFTNARNSEHGWYSEREPTFSSNLNCDFSPCPLTLCMIKRGAKLKICLCHCVLHVGVYNVKRCTCTWLLSNSLLGHDKWNKRWSFMGN